MTVVPSIGLEPISWIVTKQKHNMKIIKMIIETTIIAIHVINATYTKRDT